MENLLAPRRPIGVSIIAFLAGAQGILTLILAVLTLFPIFGGQLPPAFVGLFFALVIFGIVILCIAWGLWNLKRWAFWTVVVLEIISMIGAFISIFNVSGTTNLINELVNLAIPVIILIYMLADRDVRAAFRI
jgi:hypothetical protein